MGGASASFLALCTTALASSSPGMSVSERVRRADRIVRVTVEARRVLPDARDPRRVETITRVRVREHLKGGAVAFIDVAQLGGQRDGWASQVVGDAQLSEGADVVLFLDCDVRALVPSDRATGVPRCALVGLAEGALRVEKVGRQEQVQVMGAGGNREALTMDALRRRIRDTDASRTPVRKDPVEVTR